MRASSSRADIKVRRRAEVGRPRWGRRPVVGPPRAGGACRWIGWERGSPPWARNLTGLTWWAWTGGACRAWPRCSCSGVAWSPARSRPRARPPIGSAGSGSGSTPATRPAVAPPLGPAAGLRPGGPPRAPRPAPAASRGVEQASCPEVLGRLLRRGVGVAATGGRRAGVAAAMVGWTLTHAGLDPTVVLARPRPQLGRPRPAGPGPARGRRGRRASGPGGRPGAEVVLVLVDGRARGPVGRDPPMGRGGAAGRLRPGPGRRGGRGRRTRPGRRGRVEWFSLEPGHDWWGADLREDRGRFRFRVFHRGRFVVEVRLQVPGRHASWGPWRRSRPAAGSTWRPGRSGRGWRSSRASRGDSRPGGATGVLRWWTTRPTTPPRWARPWPSPGRSSAAAGSGPSTRPGRVGRLGPSAAAFSAADRVLIIDERGPGRRRAEGRGAWRGRWRRRGRGPDRAAGPGRGDPELDRHLEPGDVLLTLGAGDVGTIADAFIRRLPRDRQGG